MASKQPEAVKKDDAEESVTPALPEKLQQQTDAYLLRCAKVNHIAQERDRKQLEAKLRNELLSNRLAFRNVKVKPHGYEVRTASLHLGPASLLHVFSSLHEPDIA